MSLVIDIPNLKMKILRFFWTSSSENLHAEKIECSHSTIQMRLHSNEKIQKFLALVPRLLRNPSLYRFACASLLGSWPQAMISLLNCSLQRKLVLVHKFSTTFDLFQMLCAECRSTQEEERGWMNFWNRNRVVSTKVLLKIFLNIEN